MLRFEVSEVTAIFTAVAVHLVAAFSLSEVSPCCVQGAGILAMSLCTGVGVVIAWLLHQTLWMVEQSWWTMRGMSDRLSFAEKRLMNNELQPHELLRQIQTAIVSRGGRGTV